MPDQLITETAKNFNLYKETLGFLIATSGITGYMLGLKHGREQTEKQIEPLKKQIDMMQKLQEASDESCKTEIEYLKVQCIEIKKENKTLQADLRLAINQICPITNNNFSE